MEKFKKNKLHNKLYHKQSNKQNNKLNKINRLLSNNLR